MRHPWTPCRAAWPALGLLTLAAVPAWAQQAMQQAQQAQQAQQDTQGGGSAANTQPPLELRMSVMQTFTNNVDLSDTDKRADAITRLSPGLRWVSRAGRVRGFVDYSLNTLTYLRDNSTDLRNALASNATAELLERHAYLDAQAVISQQSINPLDAQSTDDQVGRRNRTEVRTLNLTPRVQGRLGDVAQWDASLGYQTSHSTSANAPSFSSTTTQARLGNGEALTALRWSLQASHIARSFSSGRSTAQDTVRGVLDYRINPELSTGVIAGWESTDIASSTKQNRTNYGLRLNWVPSERARLNAEVERRFFGNAHNVSFFYRLPRAVLSYTDVRSLSNGVGQPSTVTEGTWYNVLDKSIPSSVTNPAERDALVRDYLSQYNITANPEVLQAFLSSGVTVSRQQQLSFAWLLQRDTITFTLQQSDGRRISTVVAGSDVFSSFSNIQQRGYSLTLAHRLTALSTLSLGLTQRETSGGELETRLRTMTAAWSTQLNTRAKFSLLGRHSRFTSPSAPYSESALVGTLATTF
ncbi:TIGR03016 family PEP-CTERM system-associated outer membrane protein [Azohydromonas australica]|uniref:TIGR03016 family PEP-CTERM system-associated outer membrane protein n=1 Tax=Azohydromonas australica TaxID=364039 RepID=UPI000400A41C|nr:TIGR03016 family PEP-CTERM system-associated outer membrane protein [Azohydromonas australica]